MVAAAAAAVEVTFINGALLQNRVVQANKCVHTVSEVSSR